MTQLGSARGYVTHSVTTASPQRLVVMLYDRLILDLDRAEIAVVARDISSAHDALVHAQDIVTALEGALDVTAWPAGKGLAALYEFVGALLVDSNLQKDAAMIRQCRDLLAPLRDAWNEAISSLNSNVA